MRSAPSRTDGSPLSARINGRDPRPDLCIEWEASPAVLNRSTPFMGATPHAPAQPQRVRAHALPMAPGLSACLTYFAIRFLRRPQDRSELQAAQADSAARLAESQQELLQARAELDQAKALVTSKDAQLEALRAEIIAANDRLAQAARDFEQERRARTEQAEQARTAQDALERELREAEARSEQLRADMVRTQSEASQRFDRMLVEHREAVSSVQRTCDARLAEKDTQIRRLQARVEAATSQELDLQMQAVRSAQQMEHLEEQAGVMRAELETARSALQASRDQVQATQAQLIEHLKASQGQVLATAASEPAAASTT